MIYPNNGGVIGAPTLPFGAPTVGNPLNSSQTQPQQIDQTPLGGSKRAVSFAADHQGCGF